MLATKTTEYLLVKSWESRENGATENLIMKPQSSFRHFVCAALIASAFVVSSCQKESEEVSDNFSDAIEAQPRPGLTLANYDRLGTGAATYEDVSTTFGSAGNQQSSSEMGGKKTATYTWTSEGGSGQVNAIFENNILVSKSQHGLK